MDLLLVTSIIIDSPLMLIDGNYNNHSRCSIYFFFFFFAIDFENYSIQSLDFLLFSVVIPMRGKSFPQKRLTFFAPFANSERKCSRFFSYLKMPVRTPRMRPTTLTQKSQRKTKRNSLNSQKNSENQKKSSKKLSSKCSSEDVECTFDNPAESFFAQNSRKSCSSPKKNRFFIKNISLTNTFSWTLPMQFLQPS